MYERTVSGSSRSVPRTMMARTVLLPTVATAGLSPGAGGAMAVLGAGAGGAASCASAGSPASAVPSSKIEASRRGSSDPER